MNQSTKIEQNAVRDRQDLILNLKKAVLALQSESGLNSNISLLNGLIEEVCNELETREERYRKLIESITDYAIFIIDGNGYVVSWSRGAEQIKGYTAEEIIGKHISVFYTEEELLEREPEINLQNAIKFGHFEREGWRVRKDKTRFWANILFTPIIDATGSLVGFWKIVRDITDRKIAEDKLKQSEQLFRKLVESSPDATVIANKRGIIQVVNEQTERLFGYAKEELVGNKVEMLIPLKYSSSHEHHRTTYVQQPKRRFMGEGKELEGRRKDGSNFPVEIALSPITIGLQDEELISAAIRDITERKKYEEVIREQAILLEKANDAIIVSDMNNCILFWNQSAEIMFGWSKEEMLGKEAHTLLYKKNNSAIQEALKTFEQKGEWSGELQQCRKDGVLITTHTSWTLIERDGKPKSKLEISVNITEKKKLEVQFLRAQRLESIGTLASGIAHDINNVLSPVLLSIDILGIQLQDETSKKVLKTMELSARRGADLVKQVLSFSRGIEGERINLKIHQIIEDIEYIVKETFPKSIVFRTEVPKNLASISGDPTQINQVFMNLCLNARDAMPYGGSLEIKAEYLFIDEQYAQMHLEAKEGEYIMISVSDTGIGMSPEVIERVFEPFFTTKEIGKGTGLGLSTVLSIVRGHSGFINVYSEQGKGTTFKIYLPALKMEQESQLKIDKRAIPVGKGELILVIDDESAIREITKTTLETFNYKVLTADDGAEALAIYAQHREAIQVVISDMMMPYMDGPATIRALKRIDPTVKILGVSGLGMNGAVIAEHGLENIQFLQKPYTSEKLLKTIRAILDGK